jgi:ribosome-associated translation inhibitor RaiA
MILFFFCKAVFLSPPSSSSSSGSSTTTSLRIDCNIKTETMDTVTTKNHHQQQALAITRAFDNLAKAAAHVNIFLLLII